MSRDWHRVIYIPAPQGINKKASFTAIGNDLLPVTFTWGQNRREGQSERDAIIEQKKGYTQIAGTGRATSGGTAQTLLDRFKKKQTGSAAKNIIFQSENGMALSHLRNPNTVLYVDCHGNSQASGFRPYGLSPKGLAGLLAAHENLPTTIRWIKLFSCFSGEEADTEAGERTGEIYARQFSSFMAAPYLFADLTVYGYLGELIVNDDGTRVTESFRGRNRASATRRAFQNGREV